MLSEKISRILFILYIYVKYLVDHIKFIFLPIYWHMNYDYDKKWDDELKYLIENYDFEKYQSELTINSQKIVLPISEYETTINEKVIWIENHPYASFVERTVNKHNLYSDIIQKRASRLTIYRAHKKWKKDMKLANMTMSEKRDYKIDQILT